MIRTTVAALSLLLIVSCGDKVSEPCVFSGEGIMIKSYSQAQCNKLKEGIKNKELFEKEDLVIH